MNRPALFGFARLLYAHVGQSKRLLSVVFYFQFILLVEFDLAYGGECSCSFAGAVDIEHDDPERVLGRASAVVPFPEAHRTIRHHNDVHSAALRPCRSGPPGAAKSAAAKATGNSAGIPTIAFDLGAMQSSLVGGSGERLRAALKVVEAVSQGRALFIATCNSITSLPPELRRRFTLGTFFFDLPSAAERELIWRIYEKRYGVSGERPDDEGWTGAEIKECCRKAGRLKMPLRQAAQYTVPISKSAAEQVKSLRQQASGKFISASNAGLYRFEETTITSAPGASRRIRAVEG